MPKPAPPRRSPAPARTASATGRAGAASLPWCAASAASRSCGPATPSMAPPGSRDPNVEPDILSSGPAVSHGRGGVASTKVSISTGRPEEPGPVAVRRRWPGRGIPARPNGYPSRTVMDRCGLQSSRGPKRGIWRTKQPQNGPFLLVHSRASSSTRRSRRCRRRGPMSSCGRGAPARGRRA